MADERALLGKRVLEAIHREFAADWIYRASIRYLCAHGFTVDIDYSRNEATITKGKESYKASFPQIFEYALKHAALQILIAGVDIDLDRKWGLDRNQIREDLSGHHWPDS